MKVLYDYQAFQLQKVGGISRSFVELITNLPDDVDYEIMLKESDNIYIKEYSLLENVKPMSKSLDDFCFKKKFKGKSRLFDICNKLPFFKSSTTINERYCLKTIKEGDFDIFHPTFYETYYLKQIKNKPFVLTIHDMIPEIFQERNIQTVNKKKLAMRAEHIIAVSKNTKKDIVNILGIPEDKISVIYHGCDIKPYKKNDIKTSEKFILYVGQRSGYKSFHLFLRQVRLFLKLHVDIYLLCIGQPFTASEIVMINEYGLTKQVRCKFVSSDDLNGYYQTALAFVFPSIYEGFGIPILEAFSNGCISLLNNKSCFPEIGGTAAFYYDSDIEEDCSKKLEYILNLSLEERDKVTSLAFNRLKLFSWKESAKKLYDIYANIVK